ncbi:protein tyrosine phosphatase family protein [Thalassobaculum sp.]|uniref:protein tyrosine phosphatase family protein n=1 Tax=Thalassobaculum sp. TaxID=2022740 RepID=UPI0032EEF7DC
MDDVIQINSHFTVAKSALDEAGIRQAAEDGFQTIVNLRTENEKQSLDPEAEGRIVRDQGLSYLHHPVSGDDLSDKVVDRFRRTARTLPGPILVHCATGKRSGAMVMIHLAVEQGLSGDQAVEKAAHLGFECDTPELEEFVKGYVDRHTKARTAA